MDEPIPQHIDEAAERRVVTSGPPSQAVPLTETEPIPLLVGVSPMLECGCVQRVRLGDREFSTPGVLDRLVGERSRGPASVFGAGPASRPYCDSMPWTADSLTADRLTLRPFEERDKAALVAMYTSPEVRRFLGGPVDDAAVEALWSADIGEQWGAFCIAEQGNDEAIGSCSFDRDRGDLEVSFQFMPDRAGLGFAHEAVSTAIRWVWATLDDASIIAVTQTANVAALALLRRLGFQPEKRFEEFGSEQTLLRLDRPAVREPA
ncbi:MAG: GNAT family N-acetyltransferase [Acidimicrobiia bacterium]